MKRDLSRPVNGYVKRKAVQVETPFEETLRSIIDGSNDSNDGDNSETATTTTQSSTRPKPGAFLGPVPVSMDDTAPEVFSKYIFDVKDTEKFFTGGTNIRIADDRGFIKVEKRNLGRNTKAILFRNFQYLDNGPYLSNLPDIYRAFTYDTDLEPFQPGTLTKRVVELQNVSDKTYFQTDRALPETNSQLKNYIFSNSKFFKQTASNISIQFSLWTIAQLILTSCINLPCLPPDLHLHIGELVSAALQEITGPNSGFIERNSPFLESSNNQEQLIMFLYYSQIAQDEMFKTLTSATATNSDPIQDDELLRAKEDVIEAEMKMKVAMEFLTTEFEELREEINTAREKVNSKTVTAVDNEIAAALLGVDSKLKQLISKSIAEQMGAARDRTRLQKKVNELYREIDSLRKSGVGNGPVSSNPNRISDFDRDQNRLPAQAAKVQRESIITLVVTDEIQKLNTFRYIKLVAGYLVKRTLQSLMVINLEDVLFQRVNLRTELSNEMELFYSVHIPANYEAAKERVRQLVEEEKGLYAPIFLDDESDPYAAGTRILTADAFTAREHSWNYVKSVLAAANNPKSSLLPNLTYPVNMRFLFDAKFPQLLDAFAQLTAANLTHFGEVQKLRATTKSDKLDISGFVLSAKNKLRQVLRDDCHLAVSATDAEDIIYGRKSIF